MRNLKEISQLIDGRLAGDPEFCIKSVNSLERAGVDEITFSVKDSVDVKTLKAGALIVKHNSTLKYHNLIYVEEPYLAFSALLELFYPHQCFNDGIDEHVMMAPGVLLGECVTVGAFSYIGENAVIGDHTEIHSGVKIYNNVKIGRNCLIYSNVVIREEVEIGDNVVIQPGAVIGADGFGFTRLSDGRPVKIPQKGKVIIGNNCEIGANTCIDRSTIGETVLKEYVKLDNLVQIGHNVAIGKCSALSALTGISGSVNIGENVIMGGQVGVADHTSIADGTMIAAKTGVSGNIKKRGIYAGIPHQELSTWRKNSVIFKNLDSYVERIKAVERKVNTGETDDDDDDE